MNLPRTPVEKFYRIFEGTIQIAFLTSIPIAAFIYSKSVTARIENSHTQQEYVKIASGILSQSVKAGDDQTAIRTWAADILTKYSPTPMTNEQRQSLISGASKLSVWDTYSYKDYGYTDYDYVDPNGGDGAAIKSKAQSADSVGNGAQSPPSQ